jgi:amino acid adenylation domain-containing protein
MLSIYILNCIQKYILFKMLVKSTEFWLEQLRGFGVPTQIPIAKGHNFKQPIEFYTDRELKLSFSSSKMLRCLAQEQDVELQTILLGAWALLLSHYSSAEDVLFGTSTFQQAEVDRANSKVWSSENILPIRVKVDSGRLLLPWLEELQSLRIELRDYEHLPLAQICECSEIDRKTNLFESLLVFDNDEVSDNKQGQQLLEPINYPLTLQVIEGEQLWLKLYYDTQRFEADAIDRLLGHMHTLLTGMASNPHQILADLPMLTDAERHQLLVEWNDTGVDYPDTTIHQVFEAQVEITPEAIAVIIEDSHLTYRQLDEQANQLARYLRLLGVEPNLSIGICIERSLNLVVGILGILKAGGGYLPLDPAYPQERLALMLKDAQISILITTETLVTLLPIHQSEVVCLDRDWLEISQQSNENLENISTPDDLAYLIYTSGSTGIPKGVVMNHRPLVNLLQWQATTSLGAVGSRTLQFAPIGFDVSFQEIFSALTTGGTLVMISAELRRDPGALLHLLQAQSIERLFLPFVALQQLADVAAHEGIAPTSLREVITAGEQLQITPQLVNWFTQLPACRLYNHYGPSESHVITAFALSGAPQEWMLLPPIGTAIANTRLYILNSQFQPQPIGIPGELYIEVNDPSRGYLNRPELTAEKFIPNLFNLNSPSRLYKTGDLVRYLEDGNIDFLGRIDRQIKIRGFRIELGEIEAAVSQDPVVQEAVVVMREDVPGDKRLVAYVVLRTADRDGVERQLRSYLQQRLPEYMVPSRFVFLDALPLTPSGKVDRQALPMPLAIRSNLAGSYVEPITELEREITSIWAQILGLDCVGINDNFFELGGTSILGVQMMLQLQQKLGRSLRIVLLYQHSSVGALARAILATGDNVAVDRSISARAKRQRGNRQGNSALTEGIAIIGMDGRFPGAETIDILWDNLCRGIESHTYFTDAELDVSIDPELRADPNYVKARGIIQDAETFDAAFFGITPREAEVMDPQARVFLELVYHALERSGYAADSYDGLIGLYAGCGQNTYFERHISDRADVIDRLGAFQTMLANEKDFLATRAAYKLNLTGPSLNINTACSTSLVAIAQAVSSLISYQCDIAVAGGISIATPQHSGYLYQEEGILSPDGHCRPFDANAQGTLFNNGAGLVVLKRLGEALADGDRIYAVIRGVGINNDGANKASFTAPSVSGQRDAILMAQAQANFDPATISYIEAHGTATALGDPIELEALTQAFRTSTQSDRFCAIGSIKSNIGHTIAAAGVAGTIKTALALYYQQITPSLNFKSPNPQIDFDRSPFYVNTQLADWQAGDTPRRAGVSSFGVGGTNAHIVLEESPALLPTTPSRPQQLLLLSAKTETALTQMTTNLKNQLQQQPDLDLADVAFTLQRGRNSLTCRRFIVTQNIDTAIADLDSLPLLRSATRNGSGRQPEIVFMFPGQGSQYLNMGKTLYDSEPIFRSTVDRCAEILQPLLGFDIREIMYVNAETADAADMLRQTQFAQPALFTIEYALAQLWESWGIKPAAAIGHSIGEFVAACLAGVFSLADGLKLVATRGQMMSDLPPGSMLSVRMSAELIAPKLTPDMAIAAINGPSLCVVAGPTAAIAALQAELESAEIICKPLHTSHAFHSPMMDPAIEPFAALVKTIQLSPPQFPFVSTVSATWITEEQATDYRYWASHLRATVRFADGVQLLWQDPDRVLLEVGPRATTATLARQQAQDLKRQIAISSLGSTTDGEWTAMLQAIGQLWLSGATIDFAAFYTAEIRHRLPLPTYPFDRQRYWIDPKPARTPTPLGSPPALNSIAQVNIPAMSTSRQQQLIPTLTEVLETTSGLNIASADTTTTFLEMGLDSLSLTQVALALKQKFKIKVTFRNLLEDYPNLDTLSGFIDRSLTPEAAPAPVSAAVTIANPVFEHRQAVATSGSSEAPKNGSNGHSFNGQNGHKSTNGNGNNLDRSPTTAAPTAATSDIAALAQQQLQVLSQIMSQQLDLLARSPGTSSPDPAPIEAENPVGEIAQLPAPDAKILLNGAKLTAIEPAPKKAFGPGAKIEKPGSSNNLTPQQQNHLDRIVSRYVARTPESKREAAQHRSYLADPRTVSGFTPLYKEMVYPIVVDRSAGSKLWDIDGNEYVDITNGFGSNFFGWSSQFITDAIQAQLIKGIEIGPQTPLAGRVAKLISELTGHERVAFCNTGSEAVMAAMRLARTVTGRSKIALFSGAYHGTFDEVVLRRAANGRSLPAAPGILPSMVENTLVLDYDDPNSLEILGAQADDLAAIMVEPVQSRRPDLQQIDFLRELRQLTEKSGTAFIIDEVVTGFRVHPGGIQQHFGIQADLSSYGKVFGGGLPIGAVAGSAEYMDALDGGAWQYGDESFPEVGVTFFAGTFVRHPMALAAAEAVLTRLKAEGPALQYSLAAKVEKFVTHLNGHFTQVGAPIKIAHFSSFFYIKYPTEVPHGSLLYFLLREKGIHIWEYRPCFLSLAHTEADIDRVIQAFKESVAEMQAAGFLAGATPDRESSDLRTNGSDRNTPPQPGAKLGKDPSGQPAWYIPDPDRIGKYLQVSEV